MCLTNVIMYKQMMNCHLHIAEFLGQINLFKNFENAPGWPDLLSKFWWNVYKYSIVTIVNFYLTKLNKILQEFVILIYNQYRNKMAMESGEVSWLISILALDTLFLFHWWKLLMQDQKKFTLAAWVSYTEIWCNSGEYII